MQNKRHAFTLIELLVVVLIIGILAAVALPQYRLAVEKSRVTQAMVSVKFLEDQLRAYYLANNTYPDSLSDLGVKTHNSACGGYKQGVYFTLFCSDYYREILEPSGKILQRYCYAHTADPFENKLCQSLTGSKISNSTGGDLSLYFYQ